MIFTRYASLLGSGQYGMAMGSDGNMWSCTSGLTVYQFSPAPALLNTYTLSGSGTGYLGVCLGPDGNVWIPNGGAGGVWKINTSGVSTAYTLSGAGGGTAVCSDGTNLWVGDFNGYVYKVTTGGSSTRYSMPGSAIPIAMCYDGTNIWAAGLSGNLYKITSGGVVTTYSGGDTPRGICYGPDGRFYLTSTLGSWVWQVTSSGTFTKITISGSSTDTQGGICTDGTVMWCSGNGAGGFFSVTTGGSSTFYTATGVAVTYGILYDSTNASVYATQAGNGNVYVGSTPVATMQLVMLT